MEAFSTGQKVALGFTPLGAAAIWVALVVFAGRQLPSDLSEARALLPLTELVPGLLLGQVMGHVLPNALFGSLVDLKFAMIGVGILVMHAVYRLARVCGDGPYHLDEVDAVLDKQTQEEEAFVAIDSVEGFNVLPSLTQARSGLALRRSVCGLVYTLTLLSLLAEGVALIYNARDRSAGSLVAAFWFAKLFQSVCMVALCLHARLHRAFRVSGIRVNLAGLAGGWCLCVFLSSLPAILGLPHELAVTILEHPATGAIYALCGGVVTSVAFTLLYSRIQSRTLGGTLRGIVLCSVGFAAMWSTGMIV